MPEREFRKYSQDAARRMLPTRRRDLYLAQLALLVAQSAGVKDLELGDFTFDPDDDIEPPANAEEEVEAAKAAFGFAPRIKKQ